MEREYVSQNSKELIERLGERWSLGKASIYKRMEHVGVEISKHNGESFIYSNELATLDELNEWINNGNKLATFPKPGALVQAEGAAIEQHAIELEPLEDGYQLRQLVRTAQEKAAGVMIAQNMLTAQFLQNPSALDPDLLAQVQNTEEAIAPKSVNPLQYASSLVRKFTQNQSQTTTQAA
jgi:hypothetical protein